MRVREFDDRGRARKSTMYEGYEYLEKELAERTKYPSIEDAYQRNNLGIVLDGDVWWMTGHVSDRIYDLVLKEMKRLYPQYTYLYDLKTEGLKRRAALKESMSSGGLTLGYLLHDLVSPTLYVEIRDITSDPDDIDDVIARGKVSRILYEGKVKNLLNCEVTHIDPTYGGDLLIYGFFLKCSNPIRE